jgi:hypothetical protein
MNMYNSSLYATIGSCLEYLTTDGREILKRMLHKSACTIMVVCLQERQKFLSQFS